jgi:excisionase family DNA binding protein
VVSIFLQNYNSGLQICSQFLKVSIVKRSNPKKREPAIPARDDRVALSVREVADMLGYVPQTIRDRIREGSLPCMRLGKKWLIPADGLRKVLQEAVDRVRSGSVS